MPAATDDEFIKFCCRFRYIILIFAVFYQSNMFCSKVKSKLLQNFSDMSTVVLKKLTLANCSPEGIANIIKDKKKVKDLNYRAFLYLLKTSGTSEDKSTFLAILRNLTFVVALFDKDCEEVFNEIANIEWEKQNENFRKIIKQFLISLISSQPFYTNKVIDRAIKNLSLVDETDEIVVHETNLEILQFVSENMPTYMKFTQQKVVSNFPHKSRPLLDHQAYVTNILKLGNLIPSYFNEIIMTIIEKLVKMDVDVSRSPFAADKDELFSFEDQGRAPDDEMADKLDMVLSQFLKYMKENTSDNNVEQWCKVLLLGFDAHILKAHMPPNVPFILFYFFNIHAKLKTVLLDYFWSVFADKNQPAIIRQSGIMYLASFTNRSKSVGKADFKKIMLTTANWCHSYISNNDEISVKCNHTAFYAACQSLFYIFCYRHKEIFSSSEYKMFLDKIDLHLIVHCKLNPLKHCNQHILRMFNKLTSMYEIVACSAVIERNSRMLLPSTQLLGNEEYPFKHCLLTLTSSFIQPYFKDMECSNEFQSEFRRYKVSENFEDWDNIIGEASIAMSPDFQAMSL